MSGFLSTLKIAGAFETTCQALIVAASGKFDSRFGAVVFGFDEARGL
jgi:hypothetical protein